MESGIFNAIATVVKSLQNNRFQSINKFNVFSNLFWNSVFYRVIDCATHKSTGGGQLFCSFVPIMFEIKLNIRRERLKRHYVYMVVCSV